MDLGSQFLYLEKKALELGASDATVIPARMIPIEDRIVEMCRAPLCEGYDQSANCPPHVMTPGEARELIGVYGSALLFKIDVSPGLLMSRDRYTAFRKVFVISSGLEALAKELGYLSSKGLAAGSCKPVFCKYIACEALKEGGTCSYPSLARPSMEAIGINVFHLVKDAGWEIHSIIEDTDPESVPSAMLVGLLLVT